MEFGQTPKQLFDRPHPQRCLPTQIVTVENGVVSSDVDDRMLHTAAGACQSLHCLPGYTHPDEVNILESRFYMRA